MIVVSTIVPINSIVVDLVPLLIVEKMMNCMDVFI